MNEKEKADKERADKEAADKKERDKRDNIIANRDQDPNHPANKTLSPARENIPRPVAEGVHVAPEEMLTEQEKDTASEVPGVGPVSASETTTGPVETIEDQGIGPRTPYPTGNPPPDTEIITRSQGINKGRDDKPAVKPGETVKKEPAHQREPIR